MPYKVSIFYFNKLIIFINLLSVYGNVAKKNRKIRKHGRLDKQRRRVIEQTN